MWLLLTAVSAGGQSSPATPGSPVTLAPMSLEAARQILQSGDLDGAVAAFLAAATQAADLGDRATGFNNACVLLNRLGRYEEALQACEQAVPLRRQQGDPRRLARGLNNTALALQYLGRYDDAIAHYHEALDINRQRQDWQSVAINLSNLSLLQSTVGRFREAGDDALAAIHLAEQHVDSPWAGEQLALARINYAVVLEKLGAYEEALRIYDAALQEAPDLSPQRRAQVGVNRGVLLRNLGDPLRAVAAFEQALEVTEDRSVAANAWLNIGLVRHLNLRQVVLGEAAYRRGLELAQTSGDLAEELQGLYFLGRLLVDEGRLQDAATTLERCRQLAETSRTPRGAWLSEELGARLARAGGDLEGASLAFERALGWIETARREWVPEAWRGSFAADQRDIFVSAVETAVALADGDGSAELAWAWVQRAKSRQLLDALGGETWLPEVSLGGDAAWLEDLGNSFRQGVLLELFVGETQLHAWTLVAGKLRYHPLGPAAPILASVRRVHGSLALGQAPAEDDLNTLSSSLVASTGVLATSPKHLLVVADGLLHRMPFEMLTESGQPLVERVTLRYLPSTTLWLPLRQRDPRRATAGMQLLALGNPTLPEPGDRSAGVADLLRRRFDLPPLPAAEAEARAAQRWLGGASQLLLGAEASEENLRQWAPKVTGVLHLGTHALVDGGQGSSSAVVLTPGGVDDGLLFPREIAGLSLRGALTVLASCQSGLDVGQDDGALTTLSGAFLAAGSSAVVASLWSVDDQATEVLMEQFYFQLSRGRAPAEALRQAKLRLRGDPRWDRPWIWAAFVLIGEGSALVHPWKAKAIGGAALGLLVCLVVWFWKHRRRVAEA